MKKMNFFKLLFSSMLVLATVAFTGCKDEPTNDENPTLGLSTDALSFDEKGGAKTFDITTTGKWTITGAESDAWLAVTPIRAGSGNQQITVTVGASEVAQSATLTVKVFAVIYGVDKLMDTKTVKVSQTPGGVAPSEDVIYGNNFDKVLVVKDSGGKWPFLDQSGDWKNAVGTGIEGVTYASTNVSVRSSTKQSGGYDKASAQNKIFFGASPATFSIDGITLPTGKKNFKIIFGAAHAKSENNVFDNIFKPESFKVALGNGTAWAENVTYEAIGGSDTTDPFWKQFAVNFTLKEATSKLSIKFTANIASAFSIDDVILTEGIGGQEIVFGGGGGGGELKNVTIPELIGKMTSSQVVVDAASDCQFEAVIVTDKMGGNFNTNQLQVMTKDATTENNGFTLFGSGKYTNPADAAFNFEPGEVVKVTLKAGLARIVNFQGMYEVTGDNGAEWVVIEKTGDMADLKPVVIGVDKLAAFQGMLVTVKDAMAPATAGVWCTATTYGQHAFTVNGTPMTVFVQANMPVLVDQMFVAGSKGDVTGFATVYKNNAQICPQYDGDVEAFMGEPSTDPSITKVDPSQLSFAVAGETKIVNVTTANADGCTLEVSTDNVHFTATATGIASVSVVAKANAASSAINAMLTIKLMKSGVAVSTKIVNLTQSAPSAGGSISLTHADITAAKALGTSYAALDIKAADGSVWTGSAAGCGAKDNFLQLGWNTDVAKGAAHSHVKPQALVNNAKMITVVPNTKTIASRWIVALPADFEYTGQTPDEVKAAAYAVSPATTQNGTDPLTLDMSSANVKEFIIRVVGGAVYIDSITITD